MMPSNEYVMTFVLWFTTNAHIILRYSIYRDKIYLSRFIYTPMCDWLWDGQVYSRRQRQDFMGGKLTSKSRNQQSGLDSYCKRPLKCLFPELKQILSHHHSYLVLTALQTLYSYFVEGDTIFVGRRKTLSKRVKVSNNHAVFTRLIYFFFR